jgi:DNA replication protein DnaD
MLPSQDNSITYEQSNSLRFEHIQAELANWEHIEFQSIGDMDDSRKQREASSNSSDHTSKPVNSSTDNTGVPSQDFLTELDWQF